MSVMQNAIQWQRSVAYGCFYYSTSSTGNGELFLTLSMRVKCLLFYMLSHQRFLLNVLFSVDGVKNNSSNFLYLEKFIFTESC